MSIPSAISLALAASLLTAGLPACATPPSAPADSAAQVNAAPLTLQPYLPDANAIFQVSSVLVSGRHDAVLIDAQFSAADARKLVALVKSSGKRLTTIYISHGDPDFYFGLDTLAQAFPDAKIIAPEPVVQHIRQTQADKLKTWGPKLGTDAPKRIRIPQILHGDRLLLENQSLQIIGLDGPTPDRSFVWIPSLRAVVGGIAVTSGEHLWMADTQTPQSHADWLSTLQRIESLQPRRVIPGHYATDAPQDLAAVRFSAAYIRAFDQETAKAKDSTALIAAMKQRYPNLAGNSSLELSAKVAKGEMYWP